jgi:hypothetical protein
MRDLHSKQFDRTESSVETTQNDLKLLSGTVAPLDDTRRVSYQHEGTFPSHSERSFRNENETKWNGPLEHATYTIGTSTQKEQSELSTRLDRGADAHLPYL